MRTYRHFEQAIRDAYTEMKSNARKAHRGQWQGISTNNRPDMTTYELTHWGMMVYLYGLEDLKTVRRQIEPNLPWADNHFEERVSGHPLNPGTEWANWPWGKNADKFRENPQVYNDPGPDRVFDHTYMQRYWPKLAGRFPDGIIPESDTIAYLTNMENNRGIYFDYGDLNDVVEELHQDPTTRQAILPVFFPEDTGFRPGRRKPCSIFYHFMVDDRGFDIVYYLRSCDLVRHFRDDIYLTYRLQLWVLQNLRKKNPKYWDLIRLNKFVMLIGNLHCFANDYIQLKGEDDALPSTDQRAEGVPEGSRTA